MASKIEDYALIGDGHTAALVSNDGSIDWLCWPRFDSGACFAALLGAPEHGRWQIAPTPGADGVPIRASRRFYQTDTLVLETVFTTPTGTVHLTDFMPMRNGWPELIRLVTGKTGTVDMSMELILRFDYGHSVPWVSQLDDASGIQAVAGPDRVVLRTPLLLTGQDLHTHARFTVREGETIPFVMAYAPSHQRVPPATHPHSALARTQTFWRDWTSRCTVSGKWAEQVKRSLITLKALAYEPTGGIVAAPTTSLPEQVGGPRNWDYRFCWLRDATITLLALMRGGYYDEAAAWRAWLSRAVAGSPEQLQIMYGIGGERRLPEWEVDWLPGYQGSKPVRVGNGAVDQLQLDVFGEVMSALHVARIGGLPTDASAWAVECALVERLIAVWDQPDEGIWEVRGGRQYFTFSRVMAWVALDRAIRSAEEFHLDGPIESWRKLRAVIHADVCAKGYNAKIGSFVQVYGGEVLDASLLLLAAVGFLPSDDPRVVSTVNLIAKELTVDGLVQRYRTEETADGLPPGEGTFLACSFWLADAYHQQGRDAEANKLFERLLGLCNDVGLLAEEYDTAAGCLIGNFPQAFSHVALAHTAMNLMKHGEVFLRAATGQSENAAPQPENASGQNPPASGSATQGDAVHA
ncbi:MAG: glycoside hydrolase family 15 protein [Janthinobacterium lividum]